MFRTIVILCALCLSTVCRAADNTEPFDFAYVLEGKTSRILTVFNDSENTYIQTREKAQLALNNQTFTTRGIYFVVKGTPSKIDGTINGDAFSITWSGAKSTAIVAEENRALADFNEKTVSGTFGRIVFLNGVPREVGLVNALPENLQIKEALKALAPHGWSGTADRSIDITQNITIPNRKGESWVVVLDRLMKSLNLWVELDSQKGSLYLRDTPPKGFSVVLEDVAQNRKAFPITVGLIPHSEDFIPVVAETGPDPLLRIVNVRSIEEKDGKLRVGVINSALKMIFTDQETGKAIEAKLDEKDVTYVLPMVSLIKVQLERGDAVEIKRLVKRVPQFSAFNKLGIVKVVESEKGTEIEFKARPQTAMFSDGGKQIFGGEWRGNSFFVAGHNSQWRVTTPSDAAWIDFEESSVFCWRKPNQL